MSAQISATWPTPEMAAAVPIGVFDAHVEFHEDDPIPKKSACDWNVCVWRAESGRIEYRIDTKSIVIDDSEMLAASMDAAEIFDRIERETMVRAMELSYVDCSGSSDGYATSNVVHAAYVERSTDGMTLRFLPCGESIYTREFTTSCASGTASAAPSESDDDGDRQSNYCEMTFAPGLYGALE